jgi:hypothetical protein
MTNLIEMVAGVHEEMTPREKGKRIGFASFRFSLPDRDAILSHCHANGIPIAVVEGVWRDLEELSAAA